jgi:hypothetical protein
MSPCRALCFQLILTADKHCAVSEVEIGVNDRVYTNENTQILQMQSLPAYWTQHFFITNTDELLPS